MPGAPEVGPLVADLQQRLDAVADAHTKAWFERYLKHVIPYRGVKTPVITRIVAEWRRVHALARWSDDDQLALACALILQSCADDKFSGILYIQKHVMRRLDAIMFLEAAEDLFSRGAFVDWSTTDWFCARVLGPLIALRGRAAAARVAGWNTADTLWQRRASIVSFRAVVRNATYHPLIETTIDALVSEPERFIQTGIGWVISDLSRTYPEQAAALVERHFTTLSPEVIRRHTRHLPGHDAYRARTRKSHGHVPAQPVRRSQ